MPQQSPDIGVPSGNPSARRRVAGAVFLLLLCSVLGNLWAPHLFLGFRYHFGSIPVLISLRLFGSGTGVAAAFLSSLPIIVEQESTLPLLWIVAEPVFIALLTSRTRLRNLLLADTLYWPLFAAPVMTLIGGLILKEEFTGTATTILMHWSVGITNALLAGLIIENMPIRRWLSLERSSDPTPVHSLLFNILMTFILIPSFVIMVAGGRNEVTTRTTQIDTQLARSLDEIAAVTRLSLTRYGTALEQLVDAAERFGTDSLGGEFPSNAIAVCREVPEIILIHVYDENLEPIFTEANDPLRSYAEDHGAFLRESLSSSRMVIDHRLHLIDGRFVTFSIAHRFIRSDGRVGTIVFDINPSVFIRQVTHAVQSTHQQAVIVDGARTVIASSESSLSAGTPFTLPQGVTFEPAGPSPFLAFERMPRIQEKFRNGLFVKTRTVSPEIPWEIVVSMPALNDYHAILSQHMRNLAALMVLCLVSLGSSMILSSRLTAPLRRLSVITSTVILAVPEKILPEWPQSSVLEIDQLIRNFRAMTETLAEKFQELANVNHTLEQRVEERTRELTEANAFLSLEIRDRIRAEEERDRTLAALETQLSFQNTLLEAIPNPIFFKDRHGRYLGCNGQFLSLIRKSREEIIGKTVEDIYPAELASVYRAADNELFARGGVQQFEAEIGTPDDMRNVIFFKATYGAPDEPVAGLVGVILDITERKRFENQLESLMQELTQKNRELEGIVYAASHDLRSPLINIQGFSRKLEKSCRRVAELLAALAAPDSSSRELNELLEEAIPKSLRFINASTEKMDTLLKGLLRLSRLGRMPISIERIQMNALISSVVSTIEFQIQSTGAEIRTTDLPDCMGDRDQINQVFTNLIDNAIKYRHPERRPVVTISGALDGRQVVYHVADNGIGIAKEHAEKIWGIFQRLDPASTPGEGLGLTIVKRIIDRNGGSIRLESTPGEGSVFIVTLPAAIDSQRSIE